MTQMMIHNYAKALRAMLMSTVMLMSGTTVMADGEGVRIGGSVYGGGNLADVKTNTEVKMSTGTVEGSVYGGGKGKADNFECDKAMVGVKDDGVTLVSGEGENAVYTLEPGGTTVIITNGTVEGDVYGGGEVGRVERNTIVTIGEAGNTTLMPIVKGHVFGAGQGIETHGYSALVRGNVTVTIQGKAEVWQNVHGGGEKASVGRYEVATTQALADQYHVRLGMPCFLKAGGKCTVNIQDEAVIGKDDIDDSGDVFGAGQGVTPIYNNEVGDVNRSKRMVTKTDGHDDNNHNSWDYYEDEDGKVDYSYVWEYFATEADYLQYVETLGRASATDVVIGGKRGEPEVGQTVGTITASSDAPTVKGTVYGGSESGFVYYSTEVNIEKGTVNQDVFGGGKGLASFAEAGRVRINTNVTISDGTVGGSVYGGGQRGVTLGNVDVNMVAGTVEQDVYGGGALADTNLGNWDVNGYVEATGLTAGASVTGLYTRTEAEGKYTYTQITDESATADGGTTYYRQEATWAHTEGSAFYTTSVDLTGGTIKGDAYGGGLGQKTGFNDAQGVIATKDVEAVVWGDINVTLGSNGGSTATSFYTTYEKDNDNNDVLKSGRVFGCNNLLGSPRGDVTVTVWTTVDGKNAAGETITKTDVSNKNSTTETDHTYRLAAVYGGGNLASYEALGKKAHVIIHGCSDTSILTVYGGGNAAAVPETDVDVYSAYEIGALFGGGNGKDKYKKGNTWHINPGANVNGNANSIIYGGTVHEAYGASNEKGTITGDVAIDVSSVNSDNCPLDVAKIVGAGKNADVFGDLVLIMGCKPDTQIPLVYGGADNANVNGNVELTITSGNFAKVFGGNNAGGAIRGHIKLNIEETGTCDTPITIDQLYLGGNEASYSRYGYYIKTEQTEAENGNGTGASTETAILSNGRLQFMPRQSAYDNHLPVDTYTFDEAQNKWTWTTSAISAFTPYDEPELNVISCTRINNVFGGGFGTGAAMYADPTVNINMIQGHFYNDNTKGVPHVMSELGLASFASSENPNGLGVIGNVYGGGNAADVIGDPTVNICTEPTVTLTSLTTDNTKDVVGAYITGNVFGGGKGEADNFLCDKAMIGKNNDGIANPTGGTTVNIYNGFVRGNVYGGGQIGRVEKNTVVTIGTGDGVAPGGTATSAPIIMGNVFGGGAGEEEHGYAALVRGNPTVTIQGNAKVLHSVYGGGEIASVARYNVPRTSEQVAAAIAEGYTEAKLGMPYALKDPNSGSCTVIVQGYAEIGPEEAMQMTKTGGPDDTGYVFGAGKGILPGGTYAFAKGTTRRMVLYDADVHTTVGQEGSKWQWVDPYHTDTNKNVWEYFDDLNEYIKFIQTLALSSRTDVTINGNAFVKGSVYGGSENGIVQFNTDVKIRSGQIGACEGETAAHTDDYWTTNSEDPTKFADCSSWLFQEPFFSYDPYAKYKKEADGKYYYDTNYNQDSAGGAVVATDGHTYYGNVFGGGSGSIPYFDTTKGQSVYLNSAGQVKGNTNVTISGGHILTNVYGGCEATNVNGTATVTMTGGSVGVPRTDAQIIAHPLTGYIFGGGKGDQRVFFNKDTNVKDAVVTIEGGRVYGSVYGGGEDGHVMRNVTLTIGKQTTTGEGEDAVTTTSGPKIGTKGTSYYDGHVFGGGRGFGGDALTAGNVGGSVDVNILDGEILGSVYGGGRLASVGYGLYLTTENGYGEMRADNEYDGSYTNPSTEDAGDFFTKGRGHINITISGGTIGNEDEYAYDASNPISHTKGGNVFAGGMGRMYKLDGTTPISSLDWWKLGCVKSTKLTISGGAKIKSCVYGGGELGMVQGGNHTSADSKTVSTEIIINGGTIGTEIKSGNVTQYTFGSVFGGGYGSLTEKLDHTGSTNPTYSTYEYTYPKYIAGRVKGSTEVTMTGGTVKASVYGGGEMAAVGESKALYDSTDPKVLGETLTGNNGAPIVANTYVTISGGTIGKEKVGTTYFGGAKMGNVYGGGSGDNNTVRSGHVYGNTNVTISGESTRIYHNVYGGGAYGTVGDFDYDTKDEEVTVNNQTVTVKKVSGISGLNTNHTNSGVATVKITGGTIGYDGKENGMVFGSSRGDINKPLERDDYTAWVYDAHVIIGSSGQGTTLTTPLVKGSVYGSGENGHTYHDTEVIIHSGTIGITEDETDDNGTPEDTTDDITTPGAAYPYRGNVYGAGCGTDKYYENHAVETHDGNGQLFNPLAGIVYGTTTVNIKGGQVVRNVYGAGAMGSVGRTVTTTTTEGETTTTTTTITGGTTTINVSGGRIGVDGTVGDGNVFGAARGNADAVSNEAALVRKETTVSVTGGIVKGNVYGGGELGCVGEYTISSDYRTFTWQDTDGVTNTDNNTKNTGICNVEIDGSSAVINGNVFGAGKGKEDTFWCEKGIAYSTNVNISKGTVNGNVYGGGEVGRVETDTKVKIGDGVGTAGGASAPTITGSVFGGGAGVETHGYSALVRGNTTVTVEGNAGIGHSVYGGGEIASVGRYALDAQKMPSILQGGGYCYVTVQGNATIAEDVFGAGQGVTPHFDKDNADPSKRSRRMTLKDNWESLEGDARFDWNYLTSEDDYSTYLETLALVTHPEVTIDGSAAVSGSVFGGGELGLTKGSVIVNIQGGTITEDVYGGGSLANTNTTSSVDRDGDGVADDTPVHPTTKVNLKGGIVTRNVYGGGLGRLAAGPKAAVLYTAEEATAYNTANGLSSGAEGYVSEGDVKTPAVDAVSAVEAKVYGDVSVVLNKPTTPGDDTTYGDCEVKGTIFGCNNLNGSPQAGVDVHVYKTVRKVKGTVVDKEKGIYDVTAVYGGGNLAAYYPDDPDSRASAIANVTIDGCTLTSIGSVYGGGNAASVPATEVLINGTYEIGEAFGGGNGMGDVSYDGVTYKPNPGANVGYTNYSEHYQEGSVWKVRDMAAYDTKDERVVSTGPDGIVYGSGKAHITILGGTVHAVYGGSNTKGNVRVEARATLEDADACDFNVGEAFGGGHNAPMDGDAILDIGCIRGLGKACGGAAEADVNGNVELSITNGTYGQVFGGNDLGGLIRGSIVVNIEETGCRPIIIGELYGGGNLAKYSVYGYDENGNVLTSGSKVADPQVNVKSFTSIGNIFGGGFGEKAVMVGDPYVNINVTKGKYAETYKGKDNVIEDNARIVGTSYTSTATDEGYASGYPIPSHAKGAIGAINNVFGGGNAADVIGTPHVNVGTLTGEVISLVTSSIEDSEGRAPGEEGWSRSYQLATAEGIDIRGDVFGGGNAANVTGDTKVVIGKNKDTVNTYIFESFDSETGGNAWSSGLAQTTGETDGNGNAEVVVLTNGKYGEFVGRRYYVSSSATPDSNTRTQLIDASGNLTGLWVTISELKTYDFISYSAANGGTQYSEGTATPTGIYKVINIEETNTDCMQIQVLTNPGEPSWEGSTFYVPKSANTDGTTRTQLYKADGSEVGVWVSIKPTALR